MGVFMKNFLITITLLFLVCPISILAQYYDSIIVYPQNTQFWTGATDGITKTDGELNTIFPNVGWAVFDLSSFPPYEIYSIQFYGYVNATNWPYWSATPMDETNPLTDYSSAIYTQINNNTQQSVAYIYSDEISSFAPGWHDYPLENSAISDFQNAKADGGFAIGFIDRDLVSTYYINFDGHTQPNPPYLVVRGYLCFGCQPPISPSNLVGQVIYNPGPQVQLNWQDNSNNENQFRIKRKYGLSNEPGSYVTIGIVGPNTIEFMDTSMLPESTYSYKVYAYNNYGSSVSNVASISIPIPVELISFNCKVDNNVVILTWQTATETNNQGFEIERDSLTALPGQEWERVGFVEGNGTTTERKYYSFTDRPDPGKYKYRLKQIDFDGSFEYSSEVEVEILSPLVFSLEQNYPNPFNPSTKIKFTVPDVIATPLERGKQSQFVTLKVYDVLGREVGTLVNEEKSAGRYEVEFSAENLTSGIYFYRMEADKFIEVKKMIILK